MSYFILDISSADNGQGSEGPSISLYQRVRGGFVAQGTSFNRWCDHHGIKRQNARKALLGQWHGPKADALCQAMLKASLGREMTLSRGGS